MTQKIKNAHLEINISKYSHYAYIISKSKIRFVGKNTNNQSKMQTLLYIFTVDTICIKMYNTIHKTDNMSFYI